PAAEPDAALARARVRAPSLARDGAHGTGVLGVSRDAAQALCGRDVAVRLRPWAVGQALSALSLAAAGGRLDAASRSPGAGGADLSGARETADRDAMSARDTLFASIRKSLGVTGAEPERRTAVAERLKQHPRGVIPARGQLPPAARVKLFAQMVEAANGSAEI